jgi:hypothetical protein
MHRKNGGTIMIYLKRIVYLLLVPIIYLISLFVTLLCLALLPIGIIVSFIITGKCVDLLDLLKTHVVDVETVIDKLEEKLLK